MAPKPSCKYSSTATQTESVYTPTTPARIYSFKYNLPQRCAINESRFQALHTRKIGLAVS